MDGPTHSNTHTHTVWLLRITLRVFFQRGKLNDFSSPSNVGMTQFCSNSNGNKNVYLESWHFSKWKDYIFIALYYKHLFIYRKLSIIRCYTWFLSLAEKWFLSKSHTWKNIPTLICYMQNSAFLIEYRDYSLFWWRFPYLWASRICLSVCWFIDEDTKDI